MTSKSKNKGNGFENETAKFFNRIYNVSEFGRTPGSGAWMGKSHAIKRQGVAEAAKDTLRGDLITPWEFPFIVECKVNSSSPAFHNIIAGNDAKLDGWFKEVEYDAEQSGRNKLPLLAFKTPRKGSFIAFPATCVISHNVDLSKITHYLVYREYIIVSNDNFELISTHFFQKVVD